MICFLIGAAMDIIAGWSLLGGIAGGALFNPDSYMRLVRLEAILAAHTPLHVVARDSSGGGTVLPWSHLLDSILLLAASPLTLLMNWHDALRWAGVALGPVEVGGLCAATAWACAPLTDKGWRWTSAFLVASLVPVAGYGLPGVVHHHILLALTCVMTAGWAGRALRAGAGAGWQAGIWAAIGLWFSPETMPFTLMSFGALGVAWLCNARPAGQALRAAAAALLLLVCAIVAVDPPAGGVLAPEIDRISIVYVVMALAGCLIGASFYALDGMAISPPRRRLIGTIAAVALLVGWIACYPSVLLGPEGLLDVAQGKAMFGAISEMQSVRTWHDGMEMLSVGMLGAAVIIALAWRRRSVLWLYGAVCAVAVVALGAVHMRFSTYGAVLGAGLLPVAIACGGRHFARSPPLLGALSRVGLLALFLLPERVPMFFGMVSEHASTCSVRDAARLLAPYAGQTVLADVNDTPELLYRTGVFTVGSLYHSNAAAFMRLRAAWRSRDNTAEPASVLATGARAILACPGPGRSVLVSDLPDDTLLDRLDRGDPPAWLQRVGNDASGFVMYRPIDPRREADGEARGASLPAKMPVKPD